MRRTSFVLLLAMVASLFALPGVGRAATINNQVARVPTTPTSGQFVRIWIESDTALGETAGVETLINGVYTKHLGSYDTSGPAPANWRVDLPAQPNGTFVQYQLFTRNQSGQDYGFRGFNVLQRYTVNDGDIQWNGLRHDSFDSYYRSPFGAVPAGTPVTLRFRTFPLDVDGVSVRVYSYNPDTNSTAAPVDYPLSYLEDRVENGVNYAIWSVTLATPSSPAIWYYKFRITDRLDADWFSDVYAGDHDNLGQGGEGAPSEDESDLSYQLSIYDPNFSTPDWLRNGTVYQIFPDRFRNGDPRNDYCVDGSTTGCPTFYSGQPTVARTPWNSAIFNPRVPGPYENYYGNQFYGGDLKGITQKLDYIQGLGFDTLYLTPIFKASSNHRYDTDDYLTIDPALGTEQDFTELTAELERRGMYVILDGVFNHTSSDSLYFDRYSRYAGANGACESLSSEYRAWFEFVNSDIPCGSGDYTGWFGYDSLAVLQDASAAVRDFIYRTGSDNVVKHWYVRGADGWRFDVADEISHDWWRDFRPYAKNYNPEGPLVGEVWPDASKFLLGDQLDSVMNYRFRKNVLGFARDQFGWKDNDSNGNNEIVALAPSQFDRALKAVREDYPPQATAAMLNLLDSHDTNRALYVLSILGENEAQARDRLKLAALFQYTYIGAPMVYYGDEAGIDSPSLANGVNGPEDDPYNRAPYPWADEAGDTSIYGPANAGLIDYYTTLGRVRKQFPALRSGEFVSLLTGDTTASGSDNDSYAFARTLAGETSVVVALNQGAGSNSVAIPVSTLFADGTTLNDVLNGGSYTVGGGSVSLTLAARGGAILAPAPASADATAPDLSIAVSPAPNGAGWNNGPVAVSLNAADTGSGVREIRSWVGDGAIVVTTGATAGVAVSAEGTTSVSGRAFDNAYNSSALRSVTVQIDSVPPTITLQSRTQANGAGWNNGPVTVTWSCTDGNSGAASPTASDSLSGESDDLTATASCVDLAGNSASKSLYGIKIDMTSPTTSVTAPGGWNGSAVTLNFVASDNLSGIAGTFYRVNGGSTQAGNSLTVVDDGVYTVQFWSADLAGNQEVPNSLELRIDQAAPDISSTVSPEPNKAGWNSGPVTVGFACTFGPSGGICSTPETVTAEGVTTVEGIAESNAGISSSASVTVRIDATAPMITASADRLTNDAGWYNADVTVSFRCADPVPAVGVDVSGVAACAADQSFGEGAGQSATGSASDAAGNTASTTLPGINVDKTAPVVSVTGVSQGGSYELGNVPAAGCATEDSLSGVATDAVLSSEGGNPDGTGSFTVTCAGASDRAGNGAASVSVSFTVKAPPTIYSFSGFFAPVDNPPMLNVVQAGRAIPVKFSLGGNFGLNIFAGGSPSSGVIACSTTASSDPIADADLVVASANSLSYDAATNQYTYVWKTDKSWGGKCRQLVLKLSDGQVRTASFKFR